MIPAWIKMMYRYMIADTNMLTLLNIMDFCKTVNGGVFVRKYFNKNGRIRSIYNTREALFWAQNIESAGGRNV